MSADRARAKELITRHFDGRVDPDTIDSWPDVDVEQFLAFDVDQQAARTALRERVATEPNFADALCPPLRWGTRDDRFDVTRRALRIVEQMSAAKDADVALVLGVLVQRAWTVADMMALRVDGDEADRIAGLEDPRLSKWGKDFYSFRYRVLDAVGVAVQDRTRAEREARDAEQLARGLQPCDRCGGAGGHDHWPGFTCYECGGRQYVPVTHLRTA